MCAVTPSSIRTPSRVTSPYLVPVARILRDAPASMQVDFEAPFDEEHEFAPRGPAETDVFPEAVVHVQLKLESFSGGLRARGHVEAPWHGVCRRCSAPVLGVSEVRVNERFTDERIPEDDETYVIVHDFVDLAPLAHDAILLDLPLHRCAVPTARGCAPTAASTSTKGPVTARRRSIPGGLHWTDSNSATPTRDPRTRRVNPYLVKEKNDGRTQAQDQQSQDPQPPCGQLALGASGPQRLSQLLDIEAAPRGLPELWLVQRARRGRGQLS